MTKSEGRVNMTIRFGWMAKHPSFVKNQTPQPVYDLEERTARFGEAVIDFAKTIPRDPVTERIISQLIGAGTSVGANYIGSR